MKRLMILTAALAAALGAADPQTFTGVITDTMCGKSHGMMAGQSDAECVAMCVKNSGSQYALYDGKDVLRLSDQKTPARFAAQRVKVTGVLNARTRTIQVRSIEPVAGSK